MALATTRPTKHPKSGVYGVRVATPMALRNTCKLLFDVRAELRKTSIRRTVKRPRLWIGVHCSLSSAPIL